jgi:long-chain acyl-CoA synthetase
VDAPGAVRVGVPDVHVGEVVAAVIALRPGAELTGEELRTWAKVQLSAYKVPRLFQFVESLPKGATGKILKREIDREAIRKASTGAPA